MIFYSHAKKLIFKRKVLRLASFQNEHFWNTEMAILRWLETGSVLRRIALWDCFGERTLTQYLRNFIVANSSLSSFP